MVNAQSEFLALINAGIVVVTLIDGRVFRPGQINMMDLILSLVTLARANDESKHKSDRLSQSWANKRASISRRKMTAMCPAWLRLSADKTRFEVIEERAAVVRLMFEDSANGIGNYKITQRLNKAGVPTFTQQTKSGQAYKRQAGPTGWHGSYVAKIVNNPAVFGQFQPHKRDLRGKRVADGPAIPDYYPKIVDKELFLRAKQGRFSRDFRDQYAGKGRKGEFVSNLFSGVVRCAYCGGPMRYENKGTGPKGAIFLVCDKVKRGLGCRNVRWRYDEFEASFLYFVQELDLQSLLLKNDKQSQIAVSIQVLQGRLAMLREQQSKTYELHLENPSPGSFVARKLAELDQQIAEIEAEIERATSARDAAKAEAGQFDKGKDEIKALIDRLQNATDEDAYQLRARVASALRSLVKTVSIAGAGERHLVGFEHINKVIPHVGIDQTDWRYFEVWLRDGSFRIVKPGLKDPLFLRAQMAAPAKRGAELWPVQMEP